MASFASFIVSAPLLHSVLREEYFWSTSGALFSCSLFISAEGSSANFAFLGGIAIGSGAVSSELEGSAGLVGCVSGA